MELEDLIDIRENSAYIAFVSMIGGFINYEENGYDILAKEYKRELKYTAGNLMKVHLRESLDKAVDTIYNFFKGFPTYEQIRTAQKPIRKMRVMVTKEKKKEVVQAENANKKKQDDKMKKQVANPKLAEQLQKRKEKNRVNDDSGVKEEGTQWD